MFVIPFSAIVGDRKQGMLADILSIKKGNYYLREKFIHDNIPFIIKTASRTLGRYVEIENSEEYSIALSAFNEAINTFDITRGDNFWSYSDLVIRRKIIDFYRANKRNNRVYPFTFFENGNEILEQRLQYAESACMFEDVDTNDELELFKRNLESFGITLDGLLSHTPKHQDSIKLYIKIARLIADDEEMFKKLFRKKTIPVTDLMKKINIHPKTLEKNRKFIIAVCLILKSNLDIMKNFIYFTEKGGKRIE